MELEDSLPHTQVPATCPYPKPDQSSQSHLSHFLKFHFNIIIPFQVAFLPQVSLPKYCI